MTAPRRILVIDIGGSNVKLMLSGMPEVRKFESGPDLTPQRLVSQTRAMVRGWSFDAVSIGYPGVVRANRILADPQNLGSGWKGFPFRRYFRCPVQVINDAAMQALAHARPGRRVLFIGLGTGVGSALVENGQVLPLELNHLRFSRTETLEQTLSKRGARRLGHKMWSDCVAEMLEVLHKAFLPDFIVLGGGAAKKLDSLPPYVKRGWNSDAYLGGLRLWGQHVPRTAVPRSETEKSWRSKLAKHGGKKLHG